MELRALLIRENDRVQDWVVRACQDLTNEQVCYSNDVVDERWIGNVVLHVYDSIDGKTVQVATGQRPPDAENPPKTVADLLSYVNATHDRVAAGLAALSDAQIEGSVKVRERDVSAIEILMQGYSHAYRHIGNILDIRHLGGFETHALN